MTICVNRRFIERDFMFKKIAHNSPNLSFQQINSILDGIGNWQDLTFKFNLDSGAVKIVDNVNNKEIKPNELTGNCYDFYVKLRIQQIKDKLCKTA